MTLQEVMSAIDILSLDELRQLQIYIDRRAATYALNHELPPEERIRRLKAAAEALREGMTQTELDEMTEAMNAEYIEPFDEDLWKD